MKVSMCLTTRRWVWMHRSTAEKRGQRKDISQPTTYQEPVRLRDSQWLRMQPRRDQASQVGRSSKSRQWSHPRSIELDCQVSRTVQPGTLVSQKRRHCGRDKLAHPSVGGVPDSHLLSTGRRRQAIAIALQGCSIEVQLEGEHPEPTTEQ